MCNQPDISIAIALIYTIKNINMAKNILDKNTLIINTLATNTATPIL